MEGYLNSGIKDLITRFPEIEKMLDEYHIGCAPCNVGTCLLKDIVGIHNLPQEDEHELMARIAKVIYPDRDIEIPKIKRKKQAGPGEIKYSPPIKRLVDEHVLIKKLIQLIPDILGNIDLESDADRKLILNCVDFIRYYADKFHHAKEEEILFKYFDANLDIIKTMLQDHETGRAHVRAIVEAVNGRNKNSVIEHLNGYKDLLTEHIKKEDEILYPWIDRNLSIKQVGELFGKFDAAEKTIDEEVIERVKKFVMELENRINKSLKTKAGIDRF